MAKDESAWDSIVTVVSVSRQSVIDNNRFPLAISPKEKLENSRVFSVVKGLIGRNDILQKIRTSGQCAQPRHIPCRQEVERVGKMWEEGE